MPKVMMGIETPFSDEVANPGGLPSKRKAAKILSDKEIRGRPLTTKQRGLFGAVASGAPIRKR